MTSDDGRQEALLVVEDLEKVYNGDRAVAALRGVTFCAARGDFIALMGPSGCGKSTLLHIIGGMDAPTRGRVRIDGIQLDQVSRERITELRRREIGFVFQFFNLLPTLTVSENVGLPLLLDGAAESRVNKRVTFLLDRMGIAERAKHFPSALSGGEMQRAAVARALAAEPKLVLADEPTGNLDSESGAQVMTLMAELNNELGVTLVLATHSVEAAQYAARIIRMRDGRIE
jgi:putative ABC transport system ATP-binding protein